MTRDEAIEDATNGIDAHRGDEEQLIEWLRNVLYDNPLGFEDFTKSAVDSPGRISRAYRELLAGYKQEPEAILKITAPIPARDHSGLVSALKISFSSMCAHHFLPFFGVVDLAYEPGDGLIGIGKLSRLVDCRSKRFDLQEILVRRIAEDLMKFGGAKGAYVRSSARHSCVCFRGPRHEMTLNVASYAIGSLLDASRQLELATVIPPLRDWE